MTQPTTKERLLDAAEELFATKGYDAVSIREIAGAADVNLAAVNYHFQGKHNLYLEVLKRRFIPKRRKLQVALGAVEAAPPEAPRLEMLVRAFVGTHLEDALSSPRGLFGLHLMAREMSEPRHGARVLVKELIGPVRSRIFVLIHELLPDVDERTIQMIIGSIVGQFIYYSMYWHNHQDSPGKPQEVEEVFVTLADNVEEYIATVIDHVTAFTMGGIQALTRGGEA